MPTPNNPANQIYWRIQTLYAKPDRRGWPIMLKNNSVGIGWIKLPDMTSFLQEPDPVSALYRAFKTYYPEWMRTGSPSDFKEVENFFLQFSIGTIVVASYAAHVQGVGRVTGPYYHQPNSAFAHRYPVEWLSKELWDYPDADEAERLRQTTIKPITGATNRAAIARILNEKSGK